MTDRELMQAAIALAREAAADGEVPVGAVVTRNGEIVSGATDAKRTKTPSHTPKLKR